MQEFGFVLLIGRILYSLSVQPGENPAPLNLRRLRESAAEEKMAPRDREVPSLDTEGIPR